MLTRRKSINKSLKCLAFLKDIEGNPPRMCIWQHLSKDDMIKINALGEAAEIIDFLGSILNYSTYLNIIR